MAYCQDAPQLNKEATGQELGFTDWRKYHLLVLRVCPICHESKWLLKRNKTLPRCSNCLKKERSEIVLIQQRLSNVKYEDTKSGKELGFTASRAKKRFAWRICQTCGEGKWVTITSFRPKCRHCTSKETRQRIGPLLCGSKASNWHGGTYIEYGYRLVWVDKDDPYYCMRRPPKHYVLEHRLIMARKLGRPLESWERVHHIDGNKLNNNELNLELTTSSKHRLSYNDAFKDGVQYGYQAKLKDKEQEVQALKARIKELEKQLSPSFTQI